VESGEQPTGRTQIAVVDLSPGRLLVNTDPPLRPGLLAVRQ
jgi:hypothetical protein